MTLNLLQPADFIGIDISYKNILSIIEIVKENDSLKLLCPNQDIVSKFQEFIREYTHEFDLNEISKYHIDKITNSFFNKGIYNNIDTIQNKIDTNNQTLYRYSK